MKTLKKITALILAVIMAAGVFVLPVAAAETATVAEDGFSGYSVGEKIENFFYRAVDKLIFAIVKVLNFLLPGVNWTKKMPDFSGYTPSSFFPGEQEFCSEVAAQARWSMGFSTASLLKNIDAADGSYFLAGSLEPFKGRVPTAVVDDQAVAVYALSDGTSGIYVHAVIDGFGLARGDVNEIRNRLAAFAEEKNIISLNISVLHQHSCLDTLGMAAPLLPALVKNPVATVLDQSVVSGKNSVFMENLFTVTAAAVKNAVEHMQGGQLYYGSVDVSEFIRDKREPIVFDGNINRLRFVPDNESAAEIWVCEAAIHCVGFGAGSDKLSSDFPYYVKKFVKEQTGADVVWVQGAELAVTSDYTPVQAELEQAKNDGTEQLDTSVKAYGYALGKRLCAIDNDTPLEPVLNIAHKEVKIDADGQVLILALREGLINSVVAKKGLGYMLITEIGYMELGNRIGIFMAPGELAAEIVYGGAANSSRSWTGEEWEYAPLCELTDAETVLCFGLMNDQIGYILTDNDFRSILTENEEIMASSSRSGSFITESFRELLAKVK